MSGSQLPKAVGLMFDGWKRRKEDQLVTEYGLELERIVAELVAVRVMLESIQAQLSEQPHEE